MYNPNQNGHSHHHGYPYDPRTHTFASPAGMHYPAPNVHPLPLRPVNGEFYQDETPYQLYRQGSDGPRTGRYDHHVVPYGPGDWAPHPRVGLGISTVRRPELIPPQMAPHTSYHLGRSDHFDLPPIPNRSITLDSTAAPNRHYGNSPYSQTLARYQSPGTRTASPLSSQSSKKRNDPHFDRNGKPWPKPRLGGPPKAPLGGIGGKPWDERINDRTVSSPLPSTSSGTPIRAASTVTEEDIPTYKGNPIIFRPPPSTYLPDDSPDLPATNLDSEGRERVPRKDVYPWPVQPPTGPPETIPLPPSPIDPDPETSGRRTWTSIDSTATMESSDGLRIKGKGKGKKVVVSLPNEAAWEEQNALVRKKERSQSIRDAVFLRPAPPVQAGESGSFTESSKPIARNTIELEQAISDPHTTPPNQPSTDDPLRIRSPPTPTRRGQSSTSQGNSAFVRRQLGGMLRSGPSSRMARATPSTSSIPESQSSDKREEKDQAYAEQSGMGSESLKGVVTREESAMVPGDGPTAASSAYLTRITAGSLDDTGGNALDPARSTDSKTVATSAGEGNAINLHLLEGGLSDRPVQGGDIKDEVSSTVPGLPPPTPPQETATRRQSETETTNPTAKRLRPTAEPWVPNSRHSSGSSNTPEQRARGKLRPNAAAFTPRAMSSTSSSIHVPVGAGDFTFRTENIKHRGMQSWSSMESDDRPIFGSGSHVPTNEDAVPVSVPVPRETTSHAHATTLEEAQETRSEGGTDKLKGDSPPQTRTKSDVEHTSRYAISEPSNRSHSLGPDDMDIATARPFSSTGVEQSFSTHQRPLTAQGSPAAELHGIYASPGHSSPLSEISDSMEVLSDSFDPVSYSYETDTESTYEVSSTAVFFTSTPRGGHRVLPLNSIRSESESGRSSPEEYHTVPTVNVDQDPRRRFMEWTFPNGHGSMPSIYRRHTFDHLNLTHSDDTSESPEHGVASTFASRVGDLRAHLAKNQGGKDDESHLRVTSGPSGMISTRSSAEFPMRSPNKKLTVVNDSVREEQDQPANQRPGAVVEDATNGWDEVALRHAELTGKLADILRALDARPLPKTDLSPLTRMLEQQSTLISSLANATQQNRGHQNDHLIPLLEGQQAVLEKLTTVENTQTEVTDRLAQVDDQQSEVIAELRSQIEEITAEKNELADRVHQLDIELLESRHAQETIEKEAGEDRDELEMAQSRNAALEQYLQSLIKEKQSLAREIVEDQKTRQEQTSRFQKAQADLDRKQEELLTEKQRNEILVETIRSQTSELADLRRSTSSFQEALVDRLSRIEEGVQGSSDHSSELVKLQSRNERLQEQVDSLKEQHLLAQQEQFTEQAKTAATLRELEDLRQELSTERELRKKAEEKAETADEALQKESVLRFQAQMMAKERSHHANMQEVQLGARTRECNYWQTFALTYDRTAYRNYLKSKPFHGIDMGTETGSSNKSKSTNPIPTYEELHAAKVVSPGSQESDKGDDQQTPTKAGKGKGREVASTIDEDTEAWSSRAG